MEIHRSARRHGVSDAAIRHALGHPIVVVDLEPDSDPPRRLAIGPDNAGNLLEVIFSCWPTTGSWRSMPCRFARPLYDLLPSGGDSDG